MERPRSSRKGTDSWKNVGIHPELHKMLHKQAIDEAPSLQLHVHALLCRILKRPDLQGEKPTKRAEQAASAR